MKVVLDTNVWISALLWGGVPDQVINLAEIGQINIAASEPLLNELVTTLGYAKLQPRLQLLRTTVEALVLSVRQLVEPYPITFLTVASLRDPDDTIVLATAVSGSADVIITGDRDLLTLVQFSEIPIMTSQAFLNRYFPTLGES